MGLLWSRAKSGGAVHNPQRNDLRCVSCPMCSGEISLVGKQRLPQEFSAQCPNCGHRKVYQSTATHDPMEDAKAHRKPRAIEFGRKPFLQSIRAA